MQSNIQKIQIPIRLVQTPLRCFYCGRFGDHHICSGDLEGIIACDDHTTEALRDCQAFLHQTDKVLLRDAIGNPGLKPFFDALLLLPSFSTIRSSGALDEGWSIPDHVISCNGRICKNPAGEWVLPIEKQTEGIGRGASFQSFLVAGVPGITEELVTTAVATLNSGSIYQASAEAQASTHPPL